MMLNWIRDKEKRHGYNEIKERNKVGKKGTVSFLELYKGRAQWKKKMNILILRGSDRFIPLLASGCCCLFNS